MKPAKLRPDSVDCVHCERNIMVEGHMGYPSAGVSNDRIHNERAGAVGFSFHCPNCGHYTVYEPEDDAAKPGEQARCHPGALRRASVGRPVVCTGRE